MTRNRRKNGFYKKLQFNALNKSAEMVLTQGMIVLDNAVLSNCDVKDVILKLSFTEDNKPVTLTKKINDYYSKRCINGYRVNFIKDVSVSCWINITQPTKIQISALGMSTGLVDLEFFVLRIQ
jgi:hypothetical protein